MDLKDAQATKAMARLERRWFRAHRQATMAKARLALADGGQADDGRFAQEWLDRAEQVKRRIMRRIEAVEEEGLFE
jgi:hypothetical protein